MTKKEYDPDDKFKGTNDEKTLKRAMKYAKKMKEKKKDVDRNK